jgi:hypothetical protein
MPSSGTLRHVALVRTEVSEERIASIIGVTGIVFRLLVTAIIVPSSPILVTLMMKAIRSSETSVFQKPHSGTSQKTVLLRVAAVKISNLT